MAASNSSRRRGGGPNSEDCQLYDAHGKISIIIADNIYCYAPAPRGKAYAVSGDSTLRTAENLLSCLYRRIEDLSTGFSGSDFLVL